MELSVIIVSFNVREFLRDCLVSVRKACSNLNCEIFVVDNNSSDTTCEMVSTEFPEVILIQNQVNSGFSAANNKAILRSSGQFVLLLNPDTIVKEDTFSKCLKFMNNNPKAGAMGVSMVNGDGKFLPESRRAFPDAVSAFFKTSGLSSLFPASKLLNRYYLSDIELNETCKTEVIAGAFMFMNHEALSKAGNLDEDYFMYGEDIDLSYKIIQAGYTNHYCPDIQIVHFKGKSTPRINYTDIRHFYNSMRIYIKKRIKEGKYSSAYFILFPAIYFRQALAILKRFYVITFNH